MDLVNAEIRASWAMYSYLEAGGCKEIVPFADKIFSKIKQMRKKIKWYESEVDSFLKPSDLIQIYENIEQAFSEGYSCLQNHKSLINLDDVMWKLQESVGSTLSQEERNGLLNRITINEPIREGIELGTGSPRYIKRRERGEVPVRKF